MTWFKRLVNIGIHDSMPPEVIVNLKTTNVVNVIIAIVFLLFTTLFAVIVPPLMIITIAGSFMCGVALLLQVSGSIIVSRLITSCSTSMVAILFYLMVIGDKGEPIGLIFAAISFITLFPWFLFASSEIKFTLLAFTCNILLLIFHEELRATLTLGEGYPVMRNFVLESSILLASVSVISGVAYSMQYTNRIESQKVTRLLQERNYEKEEAQKKEVELREMLSKLQAAQKDEEKRIWASKGLAEIAKILREMHDEQQVADRLISFIVKYLKVNQGAIFTFHEDDQGAYFKMRSCYAYERKKYIDKRINIGDGIIGQCYYEKSYTHLTEVPANYVHITSGLGYATPRSLLVIPLLANDKVHGAMEFASFTNFEKYQIEFLMDAGENLAIALQNIHVNERTRELLGETQAMAEQMKAQEEEMRQNMEELAATQEQQARIENELRMALEEKEKIIERMKYQIRAEGILS